jgi:hypothetical protein
MRTSGPGSGVMESSKTSRGIDAVCGGEDVGTSYILAMAITTTTMTVIFTGSHCF